MKIPVQRLFATFLSPDKQASNGGNGRTKRVTWYTGATVKRNDWDGPYNLTLGMKPENVLMDRFASGKAPVLDTHNDWTLKDVIGVIEKGWIEKGVGYADIRFSDRPEIDPIWEDIQNGILHNASVGAKIHKLQDVSEEGDKVKSFLAVLWEPMELSLVPIGADPNAGFRAGEELRVTEAEIVSADKKGAISARIGEGKMKPDEVTNAGDKPRATQETLPLPDAKAEEEMQRLRDAGATRENARVMAILETNKACRLDSNFAERHIKAGTSIEEFRPLAIEKQAQEHKPPRDDGYGGLEIVRPEADSRRLGMIGALLERFEPARWRFDEKNQDYRFHKAGGQEIFDGARQYVGMSLLDVAKECLAVRGHRWQNKNRTELVSLAFQSSSDFPHILANTANKSLRAGYEITESQWKLIAARRTAPDFKQVSELTLDGSSRLERVPESGEFKHGRLIEGKEVWQLYTYGKIIAITRQAIINDDLGAFTRTPYLLGQEVAMLEADTVIGIITDNGNLSDGKALFDETYHFNVVASGEAISIDSLGTSRVLLMTQKSTGDKPLNIVPKFLLVPAALGQLGEQYTSPNYQSTEPKNINPLAGRLTAIIEPRLDASDPGAWYLFGDPNSPNGTVLIYAYLEGQEGPYTENRQGFDVDGTEIKIRHDFAAAAVDYRGAVKNPGA